MALDIPVKGRPSPGRHRNEEARIEKLLKPFEDEKHKQEIVANELDSHDQEPLPGWVALYSVVMFL